MKKRIMVICTALLLALGFSACSSNSDASVSNPESENSIIDSEITSEESSEITSEESSEITSEESSEITSEESSEGGGDVEENGYCEVIFDSAGGTEIAMQTVAYGEKIEKPIDPTKPNSSRYEYSFDGWYLGEREWDFERDTVSENITLTAKWKVESEYTDPFLPSD